MGILKLKQWYSLEDAAWEIKRTTGESVRAADLVEFAMGGHLQLSLYFPNSVSAMRVPEEEQEDADELVMPNGAREQIEGHWQLTLRGDAMAVLRHQLHKMTGRSSVDLVGSEGLIVQKDGAVYRLQKSYPHSISNRVNYVPLGELSKGMELVVDTLSMEKLLAKMSGKQTSGLDAEPSPKARRSYLLLIQALLKELEIDPSKPGVSTALETMTELRGGRVSDDTISKILKQISDL